MLKRVCTLIIRRGLLTFQNDGAFRVHPSVSHALAENRPVVALESTIITHGMPYPHNLRSGYQCGSNRTRQDSRCCGVCWSQVYSRHWAHSGVPRDAGCLCCHLWTIKGFPSLLLSTKWIHLSLPESALSLGLHSGVLIAVPIPQEYAAAGQQIERAIQTALAETNARGITGKDVTPNILQRVNELTQGKSLQANIALIHNNAKVGSQIAGVLSKRVKKRKSSIASYHPAKQCETNIVVVGGINVDFIAKGKTKTLQFGQTNPGTFCQSYGGVGRNIAECLSRLGHQPMFISVTGADSQSDAVFNYCKHMDTSGVTRLEGQSTATYCAVITENGELSLGLGDMDIHQLITEQYVSQFEKQLLSSTLVCLDGNIPASTIRYVCSIAKQHNINVWYEPTDSKKACKPFLSDAWKSLSYASPNLAELCTMNKTLGLQTPKVLPNSLEQVLSLAVALSRPLLEHLHCLVVTLGENGVVVCGEHHVGSVNLKPRIEKKTRKLCALHYPALSVAAHKNVSGAGDSLAGALMAGIIQGRDTDACVRMGLLAARLSLASPHPIAPMLSTQSVEPDRIQNHSWPKPTFMWID
ncbi:uncharacterized protein zgc:136858 isoform X6 [Phyllopteryx taeniolatus]|uniref:uncharacterized protein zgc:136858 isoform X6 n=1 Tax=Phyllopteryx taeniolatus TaxID=161469 RepID=UPI002AD216E4|nr:uncharacterized protein zgc:136858 isoform X6 [Phyllopteryx taeniolatus]